MRIKNLRAGWTLVESVIALSLVTLLLGGLTVAAQRGLGYFEQHTSESDQNTRVSRAFHLMMRELMGAGMANVSPKPVSAFGSSSLDFRTATGWQASAVVWGATVRFALEPAPGEQFNEIDDDGDGLVDEGVLVRVEDPGLAGETRIVLLDGVRRFLAGETKDGKDENGNGLIDEEGVSFSMDGERLIVRLSTVRLGTDGREVTATYEASVVLRN